MVILFQTGGKLVVVCFKKEDTEDKQAGSVCCRFAPQTGNQ